MAHKYLCRKCGKYFNSRFPGIKPRKRATEPCRNEVTKLHHNGWTQKSLCKHLGLGSATVERWYQDHFKVKNNEFKSALCPKVMGIDEHYFTRKEGFATTIADLSKHKVFDVTLGRSEKALGPFCKKLKGKEQVRVVLMDLSETYRAIAKKYFANAMIVADRFHVIRIVNHRFVKTWAELDDMGSKHRGLISLMRRHPERMRDDQRINLHKYLNEIPGLMNLYIVWQDLLRLLRMSRLNKKQCKDIIPEYLWIIEELKKIPFKHLQTLGNTLENWKEEIARMFRFSKTNGITEGLHNKMEMISRRAYGFRNFENYRLRVRVLCS
jgi:transposase